MSGGWRASGHLRATSFSILCKGVIRKTVQPALTGLRGSDHRMPAGVCVFAGMPIWRAVAAERYAALLARAKMDPVVADLYALFALLTLRMFYRHNRFEM